MASPSSQKAQSGFAPKKTMNPAFQMRGRIKEPDHTSYRETQQKFGENMVFIQTSATYEIALQFLAGFLKETVPLMPGFDAKGHVDVTSYTGTIAMRRQSRFPMPIQINVARVEAGPTDPKLTLIKGAVLIPYFSTGKNATDDIAVGNVANQIFGTISNKMVHLLRALWQMWQTGNLTVTAGGYAYAVTIPNEFNFTRSDSNKTLEVVRDSLIYLVDVLGINNVVQHLFDTYGVHYPVSVTEYMEGKSNNWVTWDYGQYLKQNPTALDCHYTLEGNVHTIENCYALPDQESESGKTALLAIVMMFVSSSKIQIDGSQRMCQNPVKYWCHTSKGDAPFTISSVANSTHNIECFIQCFDKLFAGKKHDELGSFTVAEMEGFYKLNVCLNTAWEPLRDFSQMGIPIIMPPPEVDDSKAEGYPTARKDKFYGMIANQIGKTFTIDRTDYIKGDMIHLFFVPLFTALTNQEYKNGVGQDAVVTPEISSKSENVCNDGINYDDEDEEEDEISNSSDGACADEPTATSAKWGDEN